MSETGRLPAASLLSIPPCVLEKVLRLCTYEEMSHVRGTNKVLKRSCERLLNAGFVKFHLKIKASYDNLKNLLPKRDSRKRSHPLYRYSLLVLQLKVKSSFLSHTFKEHIKSGRCCFFPGKVLDLGMPIIARFDGYIRTNTIVEFDRLHTLNDFDDFSGMAMDHLKKIIRPGFHIQFPSSTVEERKTLHEKKDGETSAKRHSRTRRSPSPTNRVRELGECVAEQNKVIRQLCDLLKEVGESIPENKNSRLVERIAELSTHIEENSYLKDEQGEQDTEKRMASEKSEPQPKRLKSEYLSFYEETMAYTKI